MRMITPLRAAILRLVAPFGFRQCFSLFQKLLEAPWQGISETALPLPRHLLLAVRKEPSLIDCKLVLLSGSQTRMRSKNGRFNHDQARKRETVVSSGQGEASPQAPRPSRHLQNYCAREG